MEYCVIYSIDGEVCEPVINSDTEIFEKMDMSDCYPIEIVSIYYPRNGVVMEECVFHGTWHNPQKPLQMKITNVRGGVLDIGYGTDH